MPSIYDREQEVFIDPLKSVHGKLLDEFSEGDDKNTLLFFHPDTRLFARANVKHPFLRKLIKYYDAPGFTTELLIHNFACHVPG